MKKIRAVNLDQNSKEPDHESQLAMNKATILSVNADTAPNTFRVDLKWQGNFDIANFDLQGLGKVLKIQDETPNTGWAIIERPFRVPIAHAIPGWAIAEPIYPLSPGDTIPLRPDLQPGLRQKTVN